MLDGGHGIASGPRGSRKQILHSVNPHLFAHHCCQQHLSRGEKPSNGRSMGFGLGRPGCTGFIRPGRVTLGKGLRHSELSL